MLAVVINVPPAISEYFATTSYYDMLAHFLLWFGWFPIAAVIVWGLSEVWLDRKQNQYVDGLKWDLLIVHIPAESIQTPKGMENFFNTLAGAKSGFTLKEKWIEGRVQAWFSFEIVSKDGRITFYIRCIKKFRDMIEAALYAQYPEAQVSEAAEDYAQEIPTDYPNEIYDLFGSEVRTGKDDMFPIKTYTEFEHVGEKDLKFKDPLFTLFEVMGRMKQGENYWVQLLIRVKDSQDWRKKGVKYIQKSYGKSEPKKKGFIDEKIGWLPRGVLAQTVGLEFGGGDEKKPDDFQMFKITPDERDVLEMVKAKSTQIGFDAKIRFVYWSKKEHFRKGPAASMTKGLFNQFDSGWNKLGFTGSTTPNEDYPWKKIYYAQRQRNLAKRYKNRSFSSGATPYTLSSMELATLWHFPAADARTPVLTTIGARMAEAPIELDYAGDDVPTLPNFEPSEGAMPTFEGEEHVGGTSGEPAFTQAASLSMPTPTAPTAAVPVESVAQPTASQPVTAAESPTAQTFDPSMPRPGMPAPLPPGLDLADEPIDFADAPLNIPT